MGVQPPPRGLELAASKVAHSTAFDHPGAPTNPIPNPYQAARLLLRQARRQPRQRSALATAARHQGQP
eukprot:scaffold27221_cov45-Phaeocystis_antarctica.AAC.2